MDPEDTACVVETFERWEIEGRGERGGEERETEEKERVEREVSDRELKQATTEQIEISVVDRAEK